MIDFDNYKKEISKKINDYIEEKYKKVLIFGENFNLNNKLVYLDNINSLSFHDKKNIFEQIISFHGIEKTLNPEKTLLNLRKVLTKNGKLLLIVYNFSYILNILNILKDYNIILYKDNISHFNYNSLKELIKDTGFEIISEEIYANFYDKRNTEIFIKITKNPYLAAFSFILNLRKTDKFPFIEGCY